jgi:hypothetical protein
MSQQQESPERPDRGSHAAPRPWLIAAAALAALLAWAAGETGLARVAPRQVPMVTMGTRHTGTTAETERAAVVATAARMHGIFGALLVLATSLAGSRGKRPAAAIAAAPLGAAVAVAATYLALFVYNRTRIADPSDDEELVRSLLMHGACWIPIGASAALSWGLAAGMGRRLLARAVLGGASGALLGTVAFEMLGALAFANDETGEPVPKSAVTRLLARILVATFAAALAAAPLGERRRAPAP